MKRILLIIVLFAHSTLAWSQMNDINLRLCEIRNRDQSVRLNLMNCHQRGEVDSLLYYVEEMVKVDDENQKYVANLLDEQGIPNGLSDEAYSAIFLVVDHAELNFQKRYYKFIKRATHKGLIKQSDANTLYDRIMMHSNRRQLYGTQTKSHSVIIEGQAINQPTAHLWPVRRAQSLAKRRQKAGMGTMQSQAESYEKYGGYKFVWDRSLSVKQFKTMMGEE